MHRLITTTGLLNTRFCFMIQDDRDDIPAEPGLVEHFQYETGADRLPVFEGDDIFYSGQFPDHGPFLSEDHFGIILCGMAKCRQDMG